MTNEAVKMAKTEKNPEPPHFKVVGEKIIFYEHALDVNGKITVVPQKIASVHKKRITGASVSSEILHRKPLPI